MLNAKLSWKIPGRLLALLGNHSGLAAIPARGRKLEGRGEGRRCRLLFLVYYRQQTAQLASNQWIIEIFGWFKIPLVFLQQENVAFAFDHPDLGKTGSVERMPTDNTAYYLCLNHMNSRPGNRQIVVWWV